MVVMRLRSRIAPFVIAVVTLSLVGAGAGAAGAADVDLATGGNPPGGWIADPDVYQGVFGGKDEGAPQGTVVADSGFRPYPHGFPLPNWGSADDFAQNALIYGVPQRITLNQLLKGDYASPAPLNSLALRRTLGNGVCRDPKAIDPKTGECDLILGADLLAQSIETGALGGHCFGMAAAAAALYNGQIPANQVGASGLGINAANQMGKPAIETITRLFGTQYFNSEILELLNGGTSPTEVVQTLIRELPSGQVPYVLGLIGDGGGHAITPYAVTDRGDGLFDIAVYDNNFPLQALAVTVDTTTDSFVYTSATNPNSPDYTWSSENDSVVGLVPMDMILSKQPCPVCRGKDNGTLLSFSSWESVNSDEIGINLLDANGDPLSRDLYRVFGPLNPETEKLSSAPLIAVEPGVEFGVRVATGKLKTPQPLEVYAMSNGNSEYLLMESLPSNGVIVFGVGESSALFESNKATSPRMQQLWDGVRRSIDVNGHPLVLPAGATAFQNWDRPSKRVTYDSSAKRTVTWNVQVSGFSDDGDVNWVGLGVKVPAGAKIVVDYAKATSTIAPTAWVEAKGGARTSIAMEKVTQSLIDRDRDQIYVSQGPS